MQFYFFMKKLKLAVLFSGGKDSCYALYLAQKQGHEIKCLVSMFSENPDSFMFHYPNIKFTELFNLKECSNSKPTQGKPDKSIAEVVK